MVKRAMRCHDFRSDQGVQRSQYVDIAKEHDAEMGEKSCQPFGLRPKRPLTLSRGLLISTYQLRPASRYRPFWLATHACFTVF